MNKRNLLQGVNTQSSLHNIPDYYKEGSKEDLLQDTSLSTTHQNLSYYFNKDPSMEKFEQSRNNLNRAKTYLKNTEY
jgi:hypothetical protein